MSDTKPAPAVILKPDKSVPIKYQSSSMAKSPDEKYLILGTREGVIQKFDTQSYMVTREMDTSLTSVWSLVIASDQSTFYACFAKGVIMQDRHAKFFQFL